MNLTYFFSSYLHIADAKGSNYQACDIIIIPDLFALDKKTETFQMARPEDCQCKK
jgi:hypothetical protein